MHDFWKKHNSSYFTLTFMVWGVGGLIGLLILMLKGHCR